MSFKAAVLNTAEEARTTNGMKALKSSLSNTTDLFYKLGASRGKNITPLFEKAYLENPEIALRVLQWGRDVRGGAGERELFRQNILFLEKNYRKILLETRLLNNIPEIGRWDDLLVFKTPEVREKAFGLISEALASGNGLCAKWMPRKGENAVALRTFLGWSPKYYRKRLVELTNVVETDMCAKNWTQIKFDHVPSLAMARYGKAFDRNAPTQFSEYKNKLETGEAKVNASAVYPYDVVKSLRAGNTQLANAQWNALPNFIGDASVLPMVDVSGSMGCRAGGMKELSCLDVAISLGLYCADKNTGAFKDLFLTFSTNTKFNHLKGDLAAKYRQLSTAHWDMSTNLHGAFKEILRVATTNKVAEEDMPKVLLILSDMQFNSCTSYDDSALEMIKRKYEDAGYTMPSIVFWNLNAYDNIPVRFDERGTALVSGFSPAIMKSILESNYEDMTPEAMMLKAVSSDRYAL